MISGVTTGLLLFAFLGLVAWAWSAKSRARFDAAAQLPLHDEPDDAR